MIKKKLTNPKSKGWETQRQYL